jgi:hypothetical protein
MPSDRPPPHRARMSSAIAMVFSIAGGFID